MASAICSVASASSFTRMISVSSKSKSGHESRIRSDARVSFVRRGSIPTSSVLSCRSLSWRVGRKSYSGCSFSAGQYDCGIVCSVRKLADVEHVELPPKDTTFPAAPGIYAVYDKEGDLQYVGLTRRVSTSLDIHLKENSELCGSVKFEVIDAPERAALTDAWKVWMEEHINITGKVPPGNVSGNTTWTAKKPRRAKPDILLTPGAHVKLNVPIEDLIDKVVKDCNVVAFIKGTRTSPQCGFSHRVLTILNDLGVDYETLNVLDEDHNPGVREAIKKYSEWPTIPQVYVKGEFVGGADVLDEMVQSGEIKQLLN
ncbi:unnamed protein product [Sphagnum troendelagicum]|uniref:Glutaredoxin domain-containing protein n=1 Tax=Sphagnum troendelagicum TaxID=128251 RepID=A0ABP0UIC0_9BRYO